MKLLQENKKYLIVGGLIVAGMVWYAWYGMDPREIVRGEIESIHTEENIMSIQTKGLLRDVRITQETMLKDTRGEAGEWKDLERGFTIEVQGTQEDNVLRAEAVRIIKQPNIMVFGPHADAKVGREFSITGIARTFENNILVRVVNAETGILYFRNFTTSNAPDVGRYGEYEFKVALKDTTLQDGTALRIEVFEESAKDGSEINKVAVSVLFEEESNQSATMNVRVYFGNTIQDKEVTCEKAFPVERTITKKQAVGTAALKELLRGPTEQEKQEGYFTTINEGVGIKSVRVKDGIAYADFTSELGEGVAGSCRVGFIRTQITETLKQFYTVKNVIISINGETEEILQP